MKKMLLLFAAMLICLSTGLMAVISSRVEGIVTDEISGSPVSKAVVNVFYMADERICNFIWAAETDAKGFFKIERIFFKGKYFVTVGKNGYAKYGPRLKRKIESPIQSFSEEIHTKENIDKFLFFLEQGEVKHLKIKLEKESILKINVYKKMPGDMQPMPTEAEISMYDRDFDEMNSFFIKGGYNSEGFGPSRFRITVFVKGYVKKEFDNVVLEKGTTKNIEFLADFTTGQVIHGKVRYQYNSEWWALPFGSISLCNLDGETVISRNTDERGEYWLGGFEPGDYRVTITASISSVVFVSIDREIIVKIVPNEKKELYHQF